LAAPACCRGKTTGTKVLPLGVRGSEGGFQQALWGLACRVHAYPGIHGLLYRARGDQIEVWVVAPPPMTTPLQVLAVAWAEEFSTLSPAFQWRIRVDNGPPADETGFRCLFWRGFS